MSRVIFEPRCEKNRSSVTIKSRMIGYWLSIINGDNAKISKTLYNMHFNEFNKGHNLTWINSIKNILVSAGRVDLFYKTKINNPRATKFRITQTLKDQNIQIRKILARFTTNHLLTYIYIEISNIKP